MVLRTFPLTVAGKHEKAVMGPLFYGTNTSTIHLLATSTSSIQCVLRHIDVVLWLKSEEMFSTNDLLKLRAWHSPQDVKLMLLHMVIKLFQCWRIVSHSQFVGD